MFAASCLPRQNDISRPLRTAPMLPRLLAMTLILTALSGCGRDEADTAADTAAADKAPSWLISNVLVIDGSGAAPTPGAVRIAGDTILEVGELKAKPGESVVDGGGQVLAPGFIDTHSHADSDLFEYPEALPAVSQGITTIVAGQDGSSPFPLANFFERVQNHPAAVNVASYAGHNTIREAVMGPDYKRVADGEELEEMKAIMLTEMGSGALGLATGLEYDPGIYSDHDEVLQLAQVAADQGGRYISHMRSEDRQLPEAIEEIIAIGRATGMPVQISHFKLAMKSLWGRADDILARLDAARAEGIDITADIYPYEYWQSNLLVLLPERDITDREEVAFALTELAPPDGLWMTQYDPQPEYVGKTLSEIAGLRGSDPVTTFIDLITESLAVQAKTGQPADAIIGTSMSEADIHTLLLWPHTNLCTDGALVDLHPRARGSYARVLGRYVREQKIMNLETAIYKMTGLAAAHMGITSRGLIRPGMAADLVLIDPDTVADRATPQQPEALSVGFSGVWVNGQRVLENGNAAGAYPGVVLRREAQQN